MLKSLALIIPICIAGLNVQAQTQAPTSSSTAPKTLFVRGAIESVEPSVLVIKPRSGDVMRVKVADDLVVSEVFPVNITTIRPGAFIGTSAMPNADGTLEALEVHVMPEDARGTGEGHRPWDLKPKSTMTNATVSHVVTGVKGRQLTLTYKDGEKTVIVPENVPIVTYRPGNRSLLKPGAKVFVSVTSSDGQLQAARIMVGKDGFTPPM